MSHKTLAGLMTLAPAQVEKTAKSRYVVLYLDVHCFVFVSRASITLFILWISTQIDGKEVTYEDYIKATVVTT